MKIEETKFDGLFLIKPKIFTDIRGKFIKTFHEGFFKEFGLEMDIKECFYSISEKDVIRGMHFQIPPYDHEKLVYVTYGKIIDVCLDLRRNLETYGKYYSIEISDKNGYFLYIPKGIAHGFLSLEDNTTVTYLQTSVYKKEYDKGIHYNSFGFNWNCEKPILSDRDLQFPKLKDYNSPF